MLVGSERRVAASEKRVTFNSLSVCWLAWTRTPNRYTAREQGAESSVVVRDSNGGGW